MAEVGQQKQRFQNNTYGYIGVSQVRPNGDETAIAVPPQGTVELSEREMILTANAPQDPAHNPFVEQTLVSQDPTTGERREVRLTPLTPVTEMRFIPGSERFVPGVASPPPVNPHQGPDGAPIEPPEPVQAAPEQPAPAQAPPVPSRAARAAQAASQSATPAPADTAPAESPRASTTPATQEETASRVDPDVGEETGAAVPPSGPPPEGEYAAHEEVGTPGVSSDAPTPPAPWSPQDDPKRVPPDKD